MTRTKPCEVCSSTESAMVFANDPWCCDDHRKIYQEEKKNDRD